jgi:hypothetical protein
MKIFKHVPNSLRYWKINLDHYTYMKKNGDIPPKSQFHYFFEVQESNFS